MADVFLGFGANLGDRAAAVAEAVRRLDHTSGISVRAVSSVYETSPVGPAPQPDFLNAVALIHTTLPPYALLDICLRIETELGRVRRERWGPRTLDIDVLSYEGVTHRDAHLTLPHPRMLERAFVVVPLAEIAPQLRLGEWTAAQWAKKLSTSDVGVRKLGPLLWRESAPASKESPPC